MSGWSVTRTRPSDGVWGGIASSLIRSPSTAAPVSGWLISRTVQSTGVWGGIASSLVPAAPAHRGQPPQAPDDKPQLKKLLMLGGW